MLFVYFIVLLRLTAIIQEVSVVKAFVDKFMLCTRTIKESRELSAECKRFQHEAHDKVRNEALQKLLDEEDETGEWGPTQEQTDLIMSKARALAQLKENPTRWLGIAILLRRAWLTADAIKHTLKWANKKALIPRPDEWLALESFLMLLDPFLSSVTFLQGEQYPTMSKVTRVIANLIKGLEGAAPLKGWGFNAEDDFDDDGIPIPWHEREEVIYEARNALLHGLRERFDLGNLTAGIAALCDVTNKKLGFISAQQRSAIIAQFKLEVQAVWAKQHPPAHAAAPAAAPPPPPPAHGASRFGGRGMAFMSSESEADPADNVPDAADSVEDEVTAYLGVKELDKDPDNSLTLGWWKENWQRFPHVAILARKYLAIPCSSAPSERVFSQAKLIYSRSRWNMSPETLSHLVFLRCNKKHDKHRSE